LIWIPPISLPSSGGGHSAGCGALIVVFLIVAALMAIFIAAIGWALKGVGA
jgi:hypothetical protein